MEFKRLLDVVISVAADPEDKLKYLVLVIDQLNDAQEVLGQLAFDSSDGALDWAWLVFAAFKGDTVHDRKPAPALQ